MDPFTGLGSTALACARLGVGFIGSDIDETYLAVAVDRVRTALDAASQEPSKIEKLAHLSKRGAARMGKAALTPARLAARARK